MRLRAGNDRLARRRKAAQLRVTKEAVASMTVDTIEVERLEGAIADLKMRWPPHSVPVAMWQRLEELEDALERARAGAGDGQKDSVS